MEEDKHKRPGGKMAEDEWKRTNGFPASMSSILEEGKWNILTVGLLCLTRHSVSAMSEKNGSFQVTLFQLVLFVWLLACLLVCLFFFEIVCLSCACLFVCLFGLFVCLCACLCACLRSWSSSCSELPISRGRSRKYTWGIEAIIIIRIIVIVIKI